ncbi:MAG: PASTA domain-containing protein [Thermodesulfovibrionia bacterium]|nr:PASTA domain-containing protein [Thermodesulfovibrionia bacterium]
MQDKFYKFVLYGLGFIVLSGILVLLVFKIISLEKSVKVPMIIGKSISEATELLEERGLFLGVEGKEYNLEIPSDYIISQDRAEGEKIKKGSSIKVFVSMGKAIFKIPYLEGSDIDDVEQILMELDVKIGKITRVHSYTVKKDIVIAQRPLPGFSEDNTVNLLVSSGLYTVSYRCPSFLNMTIHEARKSATILGLRLIEHDSGSVIVFQKPEAGTIITKGDAVEVTLGRGWGLWF